MKKIFNVGDTVRIFTSVVNMKDGKVILNQEGPSQIKLEFDVGFVGYFVESQLEVVSRAGGTPLTLVEKARLFSRTRHNGQFRRDGKTPYFNHCEKVASIIEADGGSEFEIAVALCHDLIEDGRATVEEIEGEFCFEFSDICLTLTCRQNVDYTYYIKKIKNSSFWNRNGANPIMNIKIADIVANLSDNPTPKQEAKYFRALKILSGV